MAGTDTSCLVLRMEDSMVHGKPVFRSLVTRIHACANFSSQNPHQKVCACMDSGRDFWTTDLKAGVQVGFTDLYDTPKQYTSG